MLPCGTTHRSAASSRCLHCPETERSLGALPLPISGLPRSGAIVVPVGERRRGEISACRELRLPARNEPGQGYARETCRCGYHAGRGAVRRRRKCCICRWLRGSGRGQERGRKVLRQGGQSDVQGAERRDGGLVHLFRIPPLSLGLPRLPWSRRRRIELRSGTQPCLEDDELSRFRERHRQRARRNVNTAQESVMPSFGTNPNVMCYIEDIFVYLRARANDAIARGRPQKRRPKRKTAASDTGAEWCPAPSGKPAQQKLNT